MSTPRFELPTVPENSTNPATPVNNSLLRLDALIDTVVQGMSLTAPPTTVEADIGKVWIPAATATGAWVGHEDELALATGANTWLFLVAPEGKKIRNLADSADYILAAGVWGPYAGGGGSNSVSIITEASTSTMNPATHSGRNKYTRAADDVTFNASEGYAAGDVYNIRATAALTLIETGVTLTPPSGGTLDLVADMAVSVIMTSSTAGDVIGQTVPV